jgi:hypothetical protein
MTSTDRLAEERAPRAVVRGEVAARLALGACLALASACGGREAAVGARAYADAGRGNMTTAADGGENEAIPVDAGGTTNVAAVDGGGRSDGAHMQTDPSASTKPFPPPNDDGSGYTGTGTCPVDEGGPMCSPPLPRYVMGTPPDFTNQRVPPEAGTWVGCEFIACASAEGCTSCTCVATDGDPTWICY